MAQRPEILAVGAPIPCSLPPTRHTGPPNPGVHGRMSRPRRFTTLMLSMPRNFYQIPRPLPTLEHMPEKDPHVCVLCPGCYDARGRPKIWAVGELTEPKPCEVCKEPTRSMVVFVSVPHDPAR